MHGTEATGQVPLIGLVITVINLRFCRLIIIFSKNTLYRIIANKEFVFWTDWSCRQVREAPMC